MPQVKKPDLVNIQWNDHCGYAIGGWIDRQQVDNKPVLINSVGFIVAEDAKNITLAGCYDTTSGGMKNVSTIIKSCIVKRKKITL